MDVKESLKHHSDLLDLRGYSEENFTNQYPIDMKTIEMRHSDPNLTLIWTR